MIKGFRGDTKGTTAIEYALIAGFLSILIVAGVTSIGTRLSQKFLTPVAGNLS